MGWWPVADLTKEQFEQLPDFLKNDYQEAGEGVYRHAGLIKVKKTADELDEKLKARVNELTEYQGAEQARIDAAKKEAYEQALKDGNSEEISKRHAEQIADAEQRALERGKNEATEEFKKQIATDKADKTALKIASDVAIDEYARDLIYRFIRGQVEHKEGKDVFLSESGSATNLDYSAFKSEVEKNPRYARLIKSQTAATGGGNANGSNGGSASSRKFNEMTGAELSELRKSNQSEYDRLKTEFYKQ